MPGGHDDCLSAVISSSATGAIFGTVAGSALANWGDVPKVIRNQSWPALKETGGFPTDWLSKSGKLDCCLFALQKVSVLAARHEICWLNGAPLHVNIC